jgi:hypothetical protein
MYVYKFQLDEYNRDILSQMCVGYVSIQMNGRVSVVFQFSIIFVLESMIEFDFLNV